MPLLVLILLALLTGTAAAAAVRRVQRRDTTLRAAAADAAADAADAAERATEHGGRRDPRTGAGLLLVLALVLLVAGGVALGALTFFVRSRTSVDGFDASVNRWAHDHATVASTDGLELVTHLGATSTVIVLGLLLAAVETARTRTRWVVPFLVAVLGGEVLLSQGIKALVDRARPTLNPVAATLGPSFPSGHTTAAAAFFAAAAFVLSRRRSPSVVPVLAGLAVGLAVGVAASRVLLGVHWVTDTFAGLALGWAWFAACAAVFGGVLLRGLAPRDPGRAPGDPAPRIATGARAGGP